MSLILDKFNINDTISLQVYPSSLYGTGFNRIKVTDLISANTTHFFNFDAAAEHAKVLADPGVPMGQIPQRFDSYQYLVFLPQGITDPSQARVIGLPWIIVDSITIEGTRDAIGYFPNISDAELNKLRIAISSVGIPAFTLDFK